MKFQISRTAMFAIGVAQEAGAMLLKSFGKAQNLTFKLRNNFKTDMDDKADQLIRKRIIGSFPKHSILSEEDDPREMKSPFTWVVDPLDGTTPYTRGFSDHWGVCIALCNKRRPVIGVIFAPAMGKLFVAEVGKGAWCNGEQLHISKDPDMAHAVVALDHSKLNRQRIIPVWDHILRPEGVLGCQTGAAAAVPIALVAAGQIDLHVSRGLEPWDMAAGVCLMREAGGIALTWRGQAWMLGDESLVAGPYELCRQILPVLLGLQS